MKPGCVISTTVLALVLAGCDLSGESNAPWVHDALPPLPKWAPAFVGKSLQTVPVNPGGCAGYVDIVTAKYGDGKAGSAVEGWGWDVEAKKPIVRVLLVDDANTIVGAADGGRERPDVPKARPDVTEQNVGWRGYSTAVTGKLRAYALIDANTSACLLGEIAL